MTRRPFANYLFKCIMFVILTVLKKRKEIPKCSLHFRTNLIKITIRIPTYILLTVQQSVGALLIIFGYIIKQKIMIDK